MARKSVSSGSVESILQAANAAGLDQINGLSITNNKLYIGNASGHVYESKLDGKLTIINTLLVVLKILVWGECFDSGSILGYQKAAH